MTAPPLLFSLLPYLPPRRSTSVLVVSSSACTLPCTISPLTVVSRTESWIDKAILFGDAMVALRYGCCCSCCCCCLACNSNNCGDSGVCVVGRGGWDASLAPLWWRERRSKERRVRRLGCNGVSLPARLKARICLLAFPPVCVMWCGKGVNCAGVKSRGGWTKGREAR